jgi:hypothetical protein
LKSFRAQAASASDARKVSSVDFFYTLRHNDMGGATVMYVIRFLATAALMFVSSASVMAAGAISFTGGTPTSDFPNRTLGYAFSTGQNPYTIRTMGIWDQGGNGLAGSHQVGIWNSAGTSLLATAVIPAGTSANLDDGFRYVSITPVTLPANSGFLAGAFTGSAGDAVIRFTTATTVPEITLGSTRFDPGPPFSGVFTAPTSTQGTTFDDGYFGLNFNGVVPEPGSMGLIAVGFSVAALLRRRR